MKAEISEQTREVDRLKRQAKTQFLQDREVNASPRKAISSNLRDGFDNDEIMLMSPSRSPARRPSSKPNTPSKKRKQPNGIDPVALPLRLTGEKAKEPLVQDMPLTGTAPPPKIVVDHHTTQHLQFMQALFAFRPFQKHDSLVEALVGFHFPSDKSQSLSSMLLFQSASIDNTRLPSQFLAILTRFIVRCLREGFYKPVPILLEAMRYAIEVDPTIIDDEAIENTVAPLQDLILINARIQWAADDRNPNRQEPKPIPKPDISIARCLELLILIANLAIDEPDLRNKFWSKLDQETTLVLLTPTSQPMQELELMLELVETSIWPDSFGNIMEPDHQRVNEGHIVDKICYLLYDPPRPIVKFSRSRQAQGPEKPVKKGRPDSGRLPAPSRVEVSNFRLKVIALLSKIAVSRSSHPHKTNIKSQYGVSVFLRHPHPIARLVRLINDEVLNLYASRLSSHALHADLINRGIYLLHHLLLSPQALNPSSPFSLVTSLRAVTGGAQRFRVALTRIHFREAFPDVGIDCGITEETTQLAQEILEAYMTPDEAWQIFCAFGKDDVDEEDLEMRDRDSDEVDAEAEAELAVRDEVAK